MVYQGSKSRYAKEIVPILQKEIDDNNIKVFIDGCCGGCNIIDKIQCETKIARDINPYLISLYKEAVYNKDFVFPPAPTREKWDGCKLNPELFLSWEVGLVSLFASYSAKGFRGGYALGGERDFWSERIRNFQKQIPNLKGIIFETGSYKDIDAENALIYLDPPYKNTEKYDFSKDFNHDDFWNKARELSKKNIVIVSEQVAPDDFEIIWEKETKRNCFNSKAVSTVERLFKRKL